MRPATCFTCCLAAAFLCSLATLAQSDNGPAALELHDRYLAAWNAQDADAFAATLHYPHYRVTRAGQVQAWEEAREVSSTMSFDRLASTGWVRTAAHNVNPVQVSADGVNVALELLRYNAAGEQIARFDTLYLVTREDGRWAFKARSSFAPR